jgi:hypothetical protein
VEPAAHRQGAKAGIGQFLDIGTSIPPAGNVHEVAGRPAPDDRVVYVDNDPIVHVHANAEVYALVVTYHAIVRCHPG